MKAITLWQPWATLIALGAKKYETRPWRTDHRGALAIHAGVSRRGLALCAGEHLIVEVLGDHGMRLESLPGGVVVCQTELVDCFPVEDAWDDLDEYERAFGDFSTGRFAWELRVVEVYAPPLPARGQQGLWEWEARQGVLL